MCCIFLSAPFAKYQMVLVYWELNRKDFSLYTCMLVHIPTNTGKAIIFILILNCDHCFQFMLIVNIFIFLTMQLRFLHTHIYVILPLGDWSRTYLDLSVSCNCHFHLGSKSALSNSQGLCMWREGCLIVQVVPQEEGDTFHGAIQNGSVDCTVSITSCCF